MNKICRRCIQEQKGVPFLLSWTNAFPLLFGEQRLEGHVAVYHLRGRQPVSHRTAAPFGMRSIGYFEKSANKYKLAPCNISEERRPPLHHEGNLKSRTDFLLSDVYEQKVLPDPHSWTKIYPSLLSWRTFTRSHSVMKTDVWPQGCVGCTKM